MEIFARNYKIKFTPRQEEIVNSALEGLTSLYNSALLELKDYVSKNDKLPKPGDFKKNYAKHRNSSDLLQLVPSQASQAVYDKLIQSVKTVMDRQRYKICADFYKEHIPIHLPEGEKKKLKDDLKETLKKHILMSVIDMFKTKSSDNPYATIPLYDGQYKIEIKDKKLQSFSMLHGLLKFKDFPDKQLKHVNLFPSTKDFIGKAKRIEIVKKVDGFYACISIEFDPSELPQRNIPDAESVTGIDFGNKYCVILSDGTKIDKFDANTKLKLKSLWKRKASIQKDVSRIIDTYHKMHKITSGFPCSKSYKIAKKKLQLIEQDIARIRDFRNHKVSNQILDKHKIVFVEDLNVAGLMQKENNDMSKQSQASMRRNMAHNSWGELKEQLVYKGKWRGNTVVKVPAKNSTQTCSNCGAIKTGENKIEKKIRVYNCDKCGFSLDRDVNAAINIEKLGKKMINESK